MSFPGQRIVHPLGSNHCGGIGGLNHPETTVVGVFMPGAPAQVGRDIAAAFLGDAAEGVRSWQWKTAL